MFLKIYFLIAAIWFILAIICAEIHVQNGNTVFASYMKDLSDIWKSKEDGAKLACIILGTYYFFVLFLTNYLLWPISAFITIKAIFEKR